MLYQKFKNAIEKVSQSCFPILGKTKDKIRLLGTGFFINSDGTFLSCCHVIDIKTPVEELILVYKDREHSFKEVLKQEDKDIYIGKIDTTEQITKLKLNDKEYDCLNRTACSIGFPGYGDTDILLSKEDLQKIILYSKICNVNSTHDEYFTDFLGNKINVNFYELNVYLNPGLSGGPTFNIDGTICGINFMSSKLQPPHSGVAFARIISAKAINTLLIEKKILNAKTP